MNIHGVSSNLATSYAHQLNCAQNTSVSQKAAASVASDPDHDGNIDGNGPDSNDGGNKGTFFNAKA